MVVYLGFSVGVFCMEYSFVNYVGIYLSLLWVRFFYGFVDKLIYMFLYL